MDPFVEDLFRSIFGLQRSFKTRLALNAGVDFYLLNLEDPLYLLTLLLERFGFLRFEYHFIIISFYVLHTKDI